MGFLTCKMGMTRDTIQISSHQCSTSPEQSEWMLEETTRTTGRVVSSAHLVPLPVHPAWTSEQQIENTALRELLRALQEILNGTGLQRGNLPLQKQIDTSWRKHQLRLLLSWSSEWSEKWSLAKAELKKKKSGQFSVCTFTKILF